MAASNFHVYGAAIEAAYEKQIDFGNDLFHMVLLTDTYTPAQSTHATFSDISASEVADGNGYTTGGKVLTTTLTRSGLVVTLDGDDQTWTSSSITAKYAAVVHVDAGTGLPQSTDIVIAYSDLDTGGGSVSSTNGDFAVTINASGIFADTVTAA